MKSSKRTWAGLLIGTLTSIAAQATTLHCEASSNNRIDVTLKEGSLIHLTTFDSHEQVSASLSEGKIYLVFISPNAEERSIEMSGKSFSYLWNHNGNDSSARGLAVNQYIQCLKK